MGLSPVQKEIVELRGCNILVSAAAGSGKTRVLVERVIGRLTDKDDPVDIDEILILTFTRAAAGEMRDRIAKAIDDLIDKGCTDEHILKQATLVHNAQITTIDSFCLNILRNNFAEIGLEPDFRTAKEDEIRIIADEVLDEVLEEVLSERTIEYLDEFLERFAGRDNLKKIRECILATYENACNAPFIEDYIEDRRKDYATDVFDDPDGTWMGALTHKLLGMVKSALRKATELRDMCVSQGPAEYESVCESDMEIIEALTGADSYEALGRAIAEMPDLKRLPTKTSCEPEVKEYAQAIRGTYKEIISEIKKDYYAFPLEEVRMQMADTYKAANALLDIVSLYHQRLSEAKSRQGLVTFSDMEHMALKILLRKEGDGYVPTQVALDYRNAYRELMIDEYQDSNRMQEWLIHSLSGEDRQVYDRFMVGDVKQSIYRFRNADPGLFMEKYDEYDDTPGAVLRRIGLSVNYRSRQEVLSSVNAVFEKIMDREVGGVDYDDENRLYYSGSYDEVPGEGKGEYRSELILIQKDPSKESTSAALEATAIASKIRDTVGKLKVRDKDSGKLRECRYGDIVILLRSMTSIGDIRKSFEAEGIPVFSATQGGYFDADEITTVLNLLKIIDNPSDDIAVYGTLISVFGGFEEEEVVCLRLLQTKRLYDAVRLWPDMEEIPDAIAEAERLKPGRIDDIAEKCRRFATRLEACRDMVPYTSVYKLLRHIYDETGYAEYVAALPAGEQKKANVLALLDKAESFEKDGFRGIFDFNRYITRLKKADTDAGDVITFDENADVVRIMTMHKSKGLEFPVCILAGLGKKFNMRDSSEEIIFHPAYGMGIDHIDTVKRAKHRDLRRRFIAEEIRRDSISEEMRVFYVAMTRAKEKLIMTAVVDDPEKFNERYGGDPLDVYDRLKLGNYLEILRRTRGDNDWFGQLDLYLQDTVTMRSDKIEEVLDMGQRQALLESKMTQMSDDEMRISDTVISRLGFEYPHPELKDLYTKTSVSELKKRAIYEGLISEGEEETPHELFSQNDEEEYIPQFAKETHNEPTGATKGSAYHKVMELIDHSYEGDFNADILDRMMAPFIETGVLTADDYALVDKDKIIRFMTGDIGRRMKAASDRGDLRREQPFVTGINADRLDPAFPKDETVLIQGIIDAYFVENGSIVLLDYKTDAVKTSEELIKRYSVQLDLYEEALAGITKMTVSERLIYSFALEELISC